MPMPCFYPGCCSCSHGFSNTPRRDQPSSKRELPDQKAEKNNSTEVLADKKRKYDILTVPDSSKSDPTTCDNDEHELELQTLNITSEVSSSLPPEQDMSTSTELPSNDNEVVTDSKSCNSDTHPCMESDMVNNVIDPDLKPDSSQTHISEKAEETKVEEIVIKDDGTKLMTQSDKAPHFPSDEWTKQFHAAMMNAAERACPVEVKEEPQD